MPYHLAIPHRSPNNNGESIGIRTPDTRLRRPLLYPTELWTHAYLKKMERMMRIELTPSAWKAEVLPLNYIRINWSGRRDSNSRPSPWQGDALPLSHSRIWCPEAESNHRHEDFQSSALPTELSGHIKNINFQIAHSLVLRTKQRNCLKTTSLFLPLPYTDSHYLGI